MPDCLHCKHFFITWDKNLPRGCRALGFKSRELPCLVVRRLSGEGCLYFAQKRPQTDKE